MQPTALYRHFDAAGQLLYVGISMCVFTRSRTHHHSKPWFKSVCRIDIEWFPSRSHAEVAEYQAIKREHPLHNGTFNRRTSSPDREPILVLDEQHRPLPDVSQAPLSALALFPKGKRKIMRKVDVERAQRDRLGRTSFC